MQTSVLPLFYRNVVPLTVERHKGHAVEPVDGFRYAAQTNSVYISAVEFSRCAQFYPIVFSGDGENLFPVALLGYREQENLFLREDGSWDAGYIPAYIRRYPFLPATTQVEGEYLVCIDEGFAGVNQQGRGERLFNDDGSKTQYTEKVLSFLSGFQNEHERTQKLCSVLPDLDLLEEKQVKVELPNGKTYILKGMKVVSREKLAKLPDSEIGEMMAHGVLELIYYHLFSLDRLNELLKRIPAEEGKSV